MKLNEIAIFTVLIFIFFACSNESGQKNYDKKDLHMTLTIQAQTTDFLLNTSLLKDNDILVKAIEKAERNSSSNQQFWTNFEDEANNSELNLWRLYNHAHLSELPANSSNKQAIEALKSQYRRFFQQRLENLETQLYSKGIEKTEINRLDLGSAQLKIYQTVVPQNVRETVTQNTTLEFWRAHTVGEIMYRLRTINSECAAYFPNKDDQSLPDRSFARLLKIEHVYKGDWAQAFTAYVLHSDTSHMKELIDVITSKNIAPHIVWKWGDIPHGVNPIEGAVGLYALEKDYYSGLDGPVLNESYIEAAAYHPPNSDHDQHRVHVSFSLDGSEIWANFTEELSTDKRNLAIVLNDSVIMVPRVNARMENGGVDLLRNYTQKAAIAMANQLSPSGFALKLKIVEENIKGPSL